MQHFILGRTNLEISRTGFGALPIQRVSFEEAGALAGSGVLRFCRGETRPGDPDLRFFDGALLTARTYWRDHPLRAKERTVLLAGGGSLAEALLTQALLSQCRVPFSCCEVHLFGDWAEYRACHPALVRSLSGAGGAQDRLVFHEGAESAPEAAACQWASARPPGARPSSSSRGLSTAQMACVARSASSGAMTAIPPAMKPASLRLPQIRFAFSRSPSAPRLPGQSFTPGDSTALSPRALPVPSTLSS